MAVTLFITMQALPGCIAQSVACLTTDVCNCRSRVVQGSHRPEKVLEFDLGPGKLLEIEKCDLVMEFCKIILENIS